MSEQTATKTFAIYDYLVLAIVLSISSAIGIYYRFTGGKQRTAKEYLLANKDMPVLPVAFSLMASFMSAITLLGVSSENYEFGTQFVIINFAYGLTTPIAAYLYLPVFFRLQATSAYEYLEKRFGPTTRLIASLAYSLQMVLYTGMVLYAPALALEALTNISRNIAILIIGVVCTFYSTIGGMKAVLITDVFQSLLMFAAIFIVIIVAAVQVGGLGEIWRIADEHQRIEFFNFSPDPTERHTFWALVIGGSITYLSLYAVNQTQVQRYLTVKNLKMAQKSLWLNWPILTLLSLSTSFSGLAIFSKYYKCDPVAAGKISKPDQLMPLYVLETMGDIPGLTGLFVSGIFSASLSTISAAVNSLAAITMEDYVKPIYNRRHEKPIEDHFTTYYSKVLAVFYGALCIGIGYSAQLFGGVLTAALTIFGIVGGPLLGLFTLGMFTTTANEAGSLTGFLITLIVCLWIGFGGPRPPPPYLPVSTEGCTNTTISHFTKTSDDEQYFYLYRLSYMWTSVIGFALTFLIGILVSNIIRKTHPNKYSSHVDSKLLASWCPKEDLTNRTRTLSGISQGSREEMKDFVKDDGVERF